MAPDGSILDCDEAFARLAGPGAIRVDSSLRQGTSVSVLLPLAPPPRMPVVQPAVEPLPSAAAAEGRPLVLVVDDEPAVRQAAYGFLEALGCAVLTAADGNQAIELFTQNADQLRVVLLDLSMPGMSGGEVFRVVHSLDSEVPVILSSGYGEDAVDYLLGEGAAGFIHKPYGLDKLRSAIGPFLPSVPS